MIEVSCIVIMKILVLADFFLLFYVANLLLCNADKTHSFILSLFDSDVCVWLFEGCARFIIDCLCDGKRVQPGLLNPAGHKSTRLCLSHQKASLHGLTLVSCICPSRMSPVFDHSLKKRAALESLFLLVMLCLFLTFWTLEIVSFYTYDSAVSRFSLSWASSTPRSLYSAVIWQRAATCHFSNHRTPQPLLCFFVQTWWMRHSLHLCRK